MKEQTIANMLATLVAGVVICATLILSFKPKNAQNRPKNTQNKPGWILEQTIDGCEYILVSYRAVTHKANCTNHFSQ